MIYPALLNDRKSVSAFADMFREYNTRFLSSTCVDCASCLIFCKYIKCIIICIHRNSHIDFIINENYSIGMLNYE